MLSLGLYGLACASPKDGDGFATEGATTDPPALSSGGGDSASSVGDTSADSGDTEPGSGTEGGNCSLQGFDPEPSGWTLPPWPGSSSPFEALAGPGRCDATATDPSYATLDLDGDGPPELVVTSSCGEGEVGGEHWIVFANEGDGFGDARPWALPQWPNAELPFPTLSGNGCATGDGPDYAVFDLDGDRAPDLVVPNGCGGGDVGDTQWIVFPNEGDGFGEATDWRLPDWPSPEAPFLELATEERCNPSTRPTYALLDLTADRRPDLVVTSACGEGGVGGSQWLVFPNEGDGFGEAVAWALPDWPNSEFPFVTLSSAGSCDGRSTPSYGLADLDGDGGADLVVTQTCGDDPTGREQWLMFPNEGDGFGDPVAWTLPDWPATVPFPTLGATAECESDSAPSYALADLDHDQRPDLVVTFACGDGAIGADRWLVFPNDGGGFADPQEFALPDWPGADEFTFNALAAPGSCEAPPRPTYGLVDLTGQGSSSLTVTFACGDGGLGSERWIWYDRDCEG